jgi:hypothetical protein
VCVVAASLEIRAQTNDKYLSPDKCKCHIYDISCASENFVAGGMLAHRKP